MNLHLKRGSAAVPAAPVGLSAEQAGVSRGGTNRYTAWVFGEDAEHSGRDARAPHTVLVQGPNAR